MLIGTGIRGFYVILNQSSFLGHSLYLNHLKTWIYIDTTSFPSLVHQKYNMNEKLQDNNEENNVLRVKDMMEM